MNPTAATQPANAGADASQFGDYSDWAQQEMAKGFTPDQLHNTLAQNGVTDYGQGQSHPGNPGGGNWFTHLLPTIGGIAGGALGSLTDIFDGPLGTIGGSAGGSALGKALENELEGKSAGNGVLQNGIEGGVGGALGGIGGKLLGKGASMLGNAAENVASRDAADAAAQEATNGIDKVANTYKDINPTLQSNLGAKDALEHVTNMGFDATDPTNLTTLSENSNGVLNDTLNKALADSGPVDLSHYPQIIKDALAKESGTLGSYEPVALSRGRLGPSNSPAAKLLSQLEGLGNAPGETTGTAIAKTGADPNEIRTLTTKLGQMAADAKPTATAATGAIDPQQRAVYNVINDVRGQVKDALYNRPEVDDAIKGMVGNLSADDVGTQQLADHLNNVITTAGTGSNPAAQDLLDEISRNIDIGKLGSEGQRVGQIVTSTGAKARAAADAGLTDVPAPAAGGAQPMDILGHLTNPHMSLLNKATAVAGHAAKNPAILSTLSRIGSLGEKLAPAVGVAATTAGNLGADPVAVTGNGTMGGTMDGNTYGMSANSTAPSMASILSQYMRMGTVDPYLLGDTSGVVQALAPKVQQQELAGEALSGVPASYANAGGAQGTGGIMSRISALIPGTAANTYQRQSGADAQALATALGISPAAAQALLPQLMQNGQSAGITNGILGQLQGQLVY